MCEVLQEQQIDYSAVGRNYIRQVGFKVLGKELDKSTCIEVCLESLSLRSKRLMKWAYYRLYVRTNNKLLKQTIHQMVLNVPIKPEIFLFRLVHNQQIIEAKQQQNRPGTLIFTLHSFLLLRKSHAFHKCLHFKKNIKDNSKFSVSRLIQKKVSQSFRLMQPLNQLKAPRMQSINLKNLINVGTNVINTYEEREKRYSSQREQFKSAENIKENKSNRYKCRTFDKPSISSLLKQREAKTPHKRQVSMDSKSETKSKTNIALQQSLTRIGRTYSITYENDSSEKSPGSSSQIKLNVVVKNIDKTGKLSKFANNKRGRSQIYPTVKKIKHVSRNSQQYQSSCFGLEDDECCSIIQQDDDQSDFLLFLDNKEAQYTFTKSNKNNIVSSFLANFHPKMSKLHQRSSRCLQKLKATTVMFLKLQNIYHCNQQHFFNNTRIGSAIGSTTFDSETLDDQIRTLERHEELLDKVTEYESTISIMRGQLMQYVQDVQRLARNKKNSEDKSKRVVIRSICRVLNRVFVEILSFSMDNIHSH